MKDFLYTPYELAIIIHNNHLENQQYIKLLNALHTYDNSFIQPKYRNDAKAFILDVMDKIVYISDPDAYGSEQTDCEKDSEQFGIVAKKERQEDYQENNMYFKELKIRIKYINSNRVVKKKFGILLSDLGYERRSSKLVRYINNCLYFYHIEATLKGNIPCNIDKVDHNDTVVFRTL